MRTATSVAIVAILAMVLGGSWVVAQTAAGDPARGQMVYEQHCLRCHGEKLDGKGPESAVLVIAPTNLKSPRSRSKTDWELLIAISHGVAFSPMHAWRERLTEQQIRDALAYIRDMAPFVS